MCDRARFEAEKIPKQRIDPRKFFGWLEIFGFIVVPKKRLLAHAHYLLDGVEQYARDPEKVGKTGRHLGSLQTLLCTAKWYTLEELMEHNRP